MNVNKDHYKYLVIQRGEVAHEAGNFERWKLAYEKSLDTIYQDIRPVLPAPCQRLLDVGSGLGGIDALLYRHYKGDTTIHLLDGAKTEPVVKKSFEPYNDMVTAVHFLESNGVLRNRVVYYTPETVQSMLAAQERYDLVVSFAAYGFHIHPGNYLQDIKRAIHRDTVLVFDVRRTKDEWLRLFVEAFGIPRVLRKEPKYVRVAFRV